MALEEVIEKLFERVVECIQPQVPDVLFVLGLEKSLVDDISPGGVGGEGDFYREDRTPRILAHLNQNREKFRDAFGFCLVLVLPRFAHKYFVRRAADFVDWGSGVFELKLDHETIEQASRQVYLSGTYTEYLKMTAAERREKRIELQTWIEESKDSKRRFQLFVLLGNLLVASRELDSALASYDQALQIDRHHGISESISFSDSLSEADRKISQQIVRTEGHKYGIRGLDGKSSSGWGQAFCDSTINGNVEGRTEEYKDGIRDRAFLKAQKKTAKLQSKVESGLDYGQIGKTKANHHIIWNNHGIAPGDRGRYEEALASYDQALEVKHDLHEAWNNRGIALRSLGRCEEAVESYDRALEFKPDDHRSEWNNRGIALADLGR
ncbi:MAG: tetratricopeptide repeat protein, partial [Coleofasciculaceae cyanobacterium RL_1_1]|nr:tetratricopeptide repeat protein [Coleofasciculaceae cyanobacterium RL_1_1]